MDGIIEPEYSGKERRQRKDEARLSNLDWNEKWKALLAIVYSVVILCDFVIIPTVRYALEPDYTDILKIASSLEPDAQAAAVTKSQILPLTMEQGGMFHLAIGAILTGAAVAGRGGINHKTKD